MHHLQQLQPHSPLSKMPSHEEGRRETKWNSNNNPRTTKQPATKPLYTVNTNRPTLGGGAAFLITEDLHVTRRSDLEHDQYFEAITIEYNNTIISNIYNSKHDKLVNHFITFISSIAHIENKFIILGDFYAHNENWHSSHTTQQGEDLWDTTTEKKTPSAK